LASRQARCERSNSGGQLCFDHYLRDDNKNRSNNVHGRAKMSMQEYERCTIFRFKDGDGVLGHAGFKWFGEAP
jgi:hypothetical protein